MGHSFRSFLLVFASTWVAILTSCSPDDSSKPKSTAAIPTPGAAPASPIEVLPAPPISDSKYIAELSSAYQCVTNDVIDHQQLEQTLLNVRSRLPAIAMVKPGQPTPWTKVRLNTAGVFFDAIQFAPPAESGDYLIFVAFAGAEPASMVLWGLEPSTAMPVRFFSARPNFHVVLDGVELPEHNWLSSYESGAFLGTRSSYLWMEFSDATPVDLHIKMKVIPRPKTQIGTRKHDPASELAILPLRRNSIASFDERISSLIEQQLYEEAIGLIDKVMANSEISPRLQLHYAKMAYELGMQQLRAAKKDSASEMYFKAAAMTRRMNPDARDDLLCCADFMADYRRQILIKKDPMMEFETKSFFLAWLYYSEACAWAAKSQPDKALESLRESLQQGLEEWHYLAEDEDLAPLQNQPEYINFISNLKAANPNRGPNSKPVIP